MTRIQLAWLNTGGSNEDYWYVLAFRLALKVTLTVRRLIPKKQKWQWTVGYRSTWLNILFPFPESFSTLVSFLSPLSGTPPASDGGVAFLCSHLHMSTGISSGAVGKRLPASGGSLGGAPFEGVFPAIPCRGILPVQSKDRVWLKRELRAGEADRTGGYRTIRRTRKI